MTLPMLKPVKPKLTPDGRFDIYLSFWSWKMLKNCPHAYRLTLFENLRPERREVGNAIQGGVPDKMAEDFFKFPLEKRRELGLQWFYDHFEEYWTIWQNQKDLYVNWMSPEEEKQFEAIDKETKIFPDNLRGKHHHRLKKEETSDHIKALVDLLNERKLLELTVKSQHSFKIKIAEGRDYVLSIGGRIDLVFEVSPGIWDIWDLKGVKKESYNDIDQLIIYKMGMEAEGINVRHTGFLLMKQKKFDLRPITPLVEASLKHQMIDTYHKTIARGVFLPNYQKWSCGYCDVRGACSTFLQKEAAKNEVKDIFSAGITSDGKVKF